MTGHVQKRAPAASIAALALLLAASATEARAQKNIRSCNVGATTVAFGQVTGQTAAETTGRIVLTCQGTGNNNEFTVALSSGFGSFAQRTMLSTSLGRLSYNLYTNPGHTIVWGDGTGGSRLATGTINFPVFGDGTATLTVFGLVPKQTPPAQGSYADFIVATVTF